MTYLSRWRAFRLMSREGWLRLVFIAGGLMVGVCAVAFALFIDQITMLFAQILAISPLIPLVLTPAGFAISNTLARRYFNFSQGSGIPQVIAARTLTDESARRRLVSMRVALGKVLLTGFGLLCGASIGREGPTVQIGASVMYAVGRVAPRRQRGLVLAGAAAGVAAAFNTPLAGIVFAIEELSQAYEVKDFSLVLSTVICGGVVSLAWMGNYDYFGTNMITVHNAVWFAVPVCGIVGGVCGGLFSQLLITVAGPWDNPVGRWLRLRPAIFAALCGLGVALCGLLTHGETYGTGYQHVMGLLHGQRPPTAYFAPLKFIATALSAISGIPGGFFSPTLTVGSSIGRTLHDIVALAPLQVMVVLGMVAYFAGVVQAPLTAAVIVTEMTNDHGLVVPVLLCALIGHGCSKLVCPEGVYHALARRYLAPASVEV